MCLSDNKTYILPIFSVHIMKYIKGTVHKYGGTSVVSAEQDNRILTRTVETFQQIPDTGYMLLVTSGIGKTPGKKKATELMYDLVNGNHPSCAWASVKDLYHQNLSDHGLGINLLNPLFGELKNILDSNNIDKAAEAKFIGLPERAKVHVLYHRARAMFPDIQFVMVDQKTGMIGLPKRGYKDVPIDHTATFETIPQVATKHNLQGKIGILSGFIGNIESINGEEVTLERGSSDATATYYGAALDLDKIVIYSDQPGISPVDPRIVPNLAPLSHLSYREASVFAGLSAKIIQDVAIKPAEENGTPIIVKHNEDDNGSGTRIHANPTVNLEHQGVRAIAADQGYMVMKVMGVRPNETGVSARIQNKFVKYGFSIAYHQDIGDGIAYAIKPQGKLEELIIDLGREHQVYPFYPMTRLAIVGHGIEHFRDISPSDNAPITFTDVLRRNAIKDLVYGRGGEIVVTAYIEERYTNLALRKLAKALGFL